MVSWRDAIPQPSLSGGEEGKQAMEPLTPAPYTPLSPSLPLPSRGEPRPSAEHCIPPSAHSYTCLPSDMQPLGGKWGNGFIAPGSSHSPELGGEGACVTA